MVRKKRKQREECSLVRLVDKTMSKKSLYIGVRKPVPLYINEATSVKKSISTEVKKNPKLYIRIK